MSNSKLLSLLCCVAFAMEASDVRTNQPTETVTVHAKSLKDLKVTQFSGFLGVPLSVRDSRGTTRCVVPIGLVDGNLLFKLAEPGRATDRHGDTMCGLCFAPAPSVVCETEHLKNALAVHWPLACYYTLNGSYPSILNQKKVRITHFALANPVEAKEPPRIVSVFENTVAHLDSELPELVGEITASPKIVITCTSWERGITLDKIEIKDEDGKKFVLIGGISYSVMTYFCGSVEEFDPEKIALLCRETLCRLPLNLKDYLYRLDTMPHNLNLEPEEEEEEFQAAPAAARSSRGLSPIPSLFRRNPSPAVPKPEQDVQTTPAPTEADTTTPPASSAITRQSSGSRLRQASGGAMNKAQVAGGAALQRVQNFLPLKRSSSTPPKLRDQLPVATAVAVTHDTGALPEGSPIIVSNPPSLPDLAVSSFGSVPKLSPDPTPTPGSKPVSVFPDETPVAEKEVAQIAEDDKK